MAAEEKSSQLDIEGDVSAAGFGHFGSEKLEQMVFSLDMDGCLFGVNETLREVLLRNAQILWDMLQKVRAQQPNYAKLLIRLMLGSNRQSADLDVGNSFRGSHVTPSAFTTMELITAAFAWLVENDNSGWKGPAELVLALEQNLPAIFQKLVQQIQGEHPELSEPAKKELLQNMRKGLGLAEEDQGVTLEAGEESKGEEGASVGPRPTVFLDRFLMADLWNQLPHGHSWPQALSERKGPDTHFDGSKVSLLYAQMHRAAHECDGRTEYHFYDDRKDILGGLQNFYSREDHLRLLPRSLELHLNFYHSNFVNFSVPTDTRIGPSLHQDGRIQGQGVVDRDYLYTAPLLVEAALEASSSRSLPLSENFSIVLGNLKSQMTEVPHFRPGNFSRDHFDAHQNLVRPKAPLDGGDLLRNQLEFFLTTDFHRGSQKAWEAFSNIIYFVRAIQNSEDSLRGEEAIFVLDNITKIYTRASNPLQTLALALQPNPGLDERQRWLGELENILTPYFGGEELISEYRGALGLERAREEESDEDHESLRTRAPSPRSSFDEDQEDQEDQRSDDAESDPLLVASRSPGRIEGIEEEAESNILILLSDLRKKGHQLFREGHVDDGRQALECAIQIQFKLAQVGSRFLESRSPSMPEVAPPARNTQGVLQECVALLQGARPALENHRGFGKVLNVLLNIFTGLLTAFIAPVAHRCVMGHWSFNSVVFKTRSVQKVDQLKDALQEGLQAG